MGDLLVPKLSKDGSATPYILAALAEMDPKGRREGLREVFRGRVELLLLWLAYHGYGKVRAVSGLRSIDEQRQLYGRGRDAEECVAAGVPAGYARPDMDRITWARPESSLHVSGSAVDLGYGPYGRDVYTVVREGCKLYGLRWGGEWGVRDTSHIEL
jgi:uncharacterized protein YcbK (DUF882 family)